MRGYPLELVSESLSKVVAQALDQVPALWNLDGPRAEAWASDLTALAVDSNGGSLQGGPDETVSALLMRLDQAGGSAAAVVAASVRSLLAIDVSGPAGAESSASHGTDIELPEWFDSLGTSTCDGAWIYANRRGESAVFRFMDSADVSHTLAIDLVPGESESIGEVAVGPADVVGLAADPESEIESTPTDPVALADRVADAFVATPRPRETFVVNGRLLIARLSTLVERDLAVPRMLDDVVPDLPEHDPDDDAFALSVLVRALDSAPVGPRSSDELSDSRDDAIFSAAAVLRQAADIDDRGAQWLAASRGPVDLDDTDMNVVLAALAACVRPHQMAPLDGDARDAVSTLEWADWLGVVIGLVREGAGASVESPHLVDLINRCPEVSSTIPKADRAQVEWSLAVCTELWGAIGLVAEDRLTPFGSWILPQVLVRAWNSC